jgi:hypothetical protein
MDFIPDNAIPLEGSQAYLSIGSGIRSTEFVRRKDDTLLFVEAKTTFPNPSNSPEQYNTQITEICEKFIHSLNLFSAVKVNVLEDVSLSAFDNSGKLYLTFILVVRNHEDKWCDEIRSELKQTLPAYLKKIWKPEVFVVNHNTARKYRLAR